MFILYPLRILSAYICGNFLTSLNTFSDFFPPLSSMETSHCIIELELAHKLLSTLVNGMKTVLLHILKTQL